MRYSLRVIQPFNDVITGERHEKGDIFESNDKRRVISIVRLKLADLIYAKAPTEKRGNKIVLYQNLLYALGGIETADYHIARTFKDRNIVFIFGRADIEQALRLADYCDVQMDDFKSEIECDVLLLTNYDSYMPIKGRVKARKIYQQCHADWREIKKCDAWKGFTWQPDEDIDKVLAVSPLVKQSLLEAFDTPIKSELCQNILCPPEKTEFRTFLTLSRFSPEKGGDILVKMVERFVEAKKHFVWFVCGDLGAGNVVKRKLGKYKNVVVIPPHIDNIGLLPKVDFYVSPSLTESYGYSIREALSYGTPVISTNIPIVKDLIKNGENGYIVDFDLHDLDIEAIFSKELKFKPLSEKVAPIWEKVLNGEL